MTRSGRDGFTLVEILVALAVLAALVAVAWAKFNTSYVEALEATLRSDLRNLATAQEIYYRAHATYSSEVDGLQITPGATSEIRITSADPMGWSAWNRIERVTTRCEVYVGNTHTSPLGIASSPERIECERP
jgi:prepilin-type N-terminal cleavage/methylation domain-containing protein